MSENNFGAKPGPSLVAVKSKDGREGMSHLFLWDRLTFSRGPSTLSSGYEITATTALAWQSEQILAAASSLARSLALLDSLSL